MDKTKNGVIHRGSQVKKGWRRAEVVVPRKRLLGRQARARECRSGAGRPGAAGTGRREASHLAAGGSRDAPTRTYPGVRVPPSSWRRGGRPAGAPGSGGGGSGAGVPVGVAAAGALGGVGGVGAGVPVGVAAAGATVGQIVI